MRVGVISRGSPDYLIDIVTDGLIRLLGRNNVSLDYNVRGGYGGAYIHLLQGFQGPEPFHINEANVLVASNRSVDRMRAWRKATGGCRSVAFIDGDDSDSIKSDILNEVKVYFKREFLKGKYYPSRIRPLPFAAIPEPLVESIEVKNSVFYSAHKTHHFRIEIGQALSDMSFPPVANQPKAAYNRCLMSSLVGVAVRGNGWDTYRYWEIPYFGAALLSQRPGIVIPGDFLDGKEAVFYDGIVDFKAKLRGLLADPKAAMVMAEAGHKACMERHLSIHRAKTVLEAIT